MYVKIYDKLVFYTEHGQGEPIFFLHGWGSSQDAFSGIAPSLSERFKVISVDFPGFGLSEEPASHWNVDNYVDFIVEFVELFGSTKVKLIGHSFGGRVIIKLATRESCPFEIEKIVLVNSAGVLPKMPFIGRVKNALPIYESLHAFLHRHAPALLKAMQRFFGSRDYLNATDIMRETLKKVANEDLTPFLSKISVPALLIWGRDDYTTPIKHGNIMKSLIPDSGLVVLENAGHYSFLDQPIAVSRILRSFFNMDD